MNCLLKSRHTKNKKVVNNKVCFLFGLRRGLCTFLDLQLKIFDEETVCVNFSFGDSHEIFICYKFVS